MTEAGRSKTDPRLTLRAKEHNHVLWREGEDRGRDRGGGGGGRRREGREKRG